MAAPDLPSVATRNAEAGKATEIIAAGHADASFLPSKSPVKEIGVDQ